MTNPDKLKKNQINASLGLMSEKATKLPIKRYALFVTISLHCAVLIFFILQMQSNISNPTNFISGQNFVNLSLVNKNKLNLKIKSAPNPAKMTYKKRQQFLAIQKRLSTQRMAMEKNILPIPPSDYSILRRSKQIKSSISTFWTQDYDLQAKSSGGEALVRLEVSAAGKINWFTIVASNSSSDKFIDYIQDFMTRLQQTVSFPEDKHPLSLELQFAIDEELI